MPTVWFGSDHTGTNQATLADDWISVTLARPNARAAADGVKRFVITEVGWKCAAAPSSKQIMYGRASNADGSVYDNSTTGVKHSWQKAATVVFPFNNINLHMTDTDNGAKLRLWLVSSGPFIFSRTTSGGTGIQRAGGGTFAGTPVGYYKYSQVALPPTGFKATRNSSDANRIDLVWKEWDAKKSPSEVGDVTSLSGYYVQIARDSGFTTGVQYRAVSGGKIALYGFTNTLTWYMRIATRNQVSEHYNLYGGAWSATSTVAATVTVDPTIDPSAGLPDGASDGSENTDTDTGMGDNNTSTSGGQSSTKLTQAQKDLKYVISQVASVQTELNDLATLESTALREMTDTAWKNVRPGLSAIHNDGVRIVARSSDPSAAAWKSAWNTANSKYQAAYDACAAAASATAGAISDNTKYKAAIKQVTIDISDVYDAVVKAKASPTKKNWSAVADRVGDLKRSDARALSYITTTGRGSESGRWDDAVTAGASGVQKANDAASDPSAKKVEAARAQALVARDKARAAISGATFPGATSDLFSQASDAISTFTDAVRDAVSVTPSTVDTGGSNDGGSSGDPGGTDDGQDGSGSTPVQTGPTIVYTPIPDTSYLRQKPGGLLLSKRTPIPEHTVFLTDRGGMTRIDQLVDLTSLRYNRIRDDQSEASIVISGSAVAKNQAALDKLAVGRHEIVIYRGTQRVWEGPITLATWKRDAVEITAKDITHYLNRTVMVGAYSNAYPNLGYVVDRIAGIIAAELPRKEVLNPPINVLPFLRTYVQEGDARTSRVTDPATMTVWQHLDDLAAKAGIDYTVIGRSLLIWDTSRAALGYTRTVTEQDFLGDTYVSAYGMELATQTYVSDGQGRFGVSGAPDDFYGSVELIATAYDENGTTVDDTNTTTDDDSSSVTQDELNDQASRNLAGRSPTPYGLHVPDGSGFDINSGLGLDVLIPGVYVPVVATLSGRTVSQMLKLKEIAISVDASGEVATITLTPASATGDDEGEGSDA